MCEDIWGEFQEIVAMLWPTTVLLSKIFPSVSAIVLHLILDIIELEAFGVSS